MCMATDIIGELSFGESFQMLETGEVSRFSGILYYVRNILSLIRPCREMSIYAISKLSGGLALSAHVFQLLPGWLLIYLSHIPNKEPN
jgi:hypothetical protein